MSKYQLSQGLPCAVYLVGYLSCFCKGCRSGVGQNPVELGFVMGLLYQFTVKHMMLDEYGALVE